MECVDDAELQVQLDLYRSEVVQLLELTNLETEGFSMLDCEAQFKQVQTSYDEVKSALLRAGSQKNTPVPVLIDILDQNSQIKLMTRQVKKAIQHLNEVYQEIGVKVPEATSIVASSTEV